MKGETTPTNWDAMVEIFAKTLSMIAEAFPGVPIHPSIGNNDVAVHDQVPTLD